MPDKVTRVTEHVIPVSSGLALDSVELSPAPIRDVAGRDTYIFYCSRPAERINAQGNREIVSRCLDAAINRSCAATANRFFDLRNDSIIDYDYTCFALPITKRQVKYKVRLKRQRVRLEDVPLHLAGEEPPSDSSYTLGLGDYVSVPLKSADSEVYALVTGGPSGNTITRVVTFAQSSAYLPEIGRIELSKVGTSSGPRARLAILQPR